MTHAVAAGEVLLPRGDGRLEAYRPGLPAAFAFPLAPLRVRRVYAAAHVVVDPLRVGDPASDAALDWDATLAFRRHLWSLGLDVAEAMDTAQRGMGLSWPVTRELIRRSCSEAHATGGGIACGAGTDHLALDGPLELSDVEAAYEEQCEFVEGEGSSVILMASRALARCARSPEDYARVYARVLSQVREPVILHWLGEMFDPALRGYWGSAELDQAEETLLEVLAEHAAKVDGIKVSLLDRDREIALRRRLPEGIRMYTGDDFNYPELIRGDEHGHSDALLGVFDAIAPAAAAALAALEEGEPERFQAVLEPTLPLARRLFEHPTRFYKTGIVFLAYLNGHQEHFRMLGGLEGARSVTHLADLFVLADRAGLLRDPEEALARLRPVLALAGVR